MDNNEIQKPDNGSIRRKMIFTTCGLLGVTGLYLLGVKEPGLLSQYATPQSVENAGRIMFYGATAASLPASGIVILDYIDYAVRRIKEEKEKLDI